MDHEAPSRQRGAMHIYEAETEELLASQHRDPLLRHLTRIIVELARRHKPPGAGVRAIDIGCGVGRTALALASAGYDTVGFDPSERVVTLAKEVEHAAGNRVAFRVGDATAPPPDDWLAAFDLAVCSEVIEHVETPERVLDFARAVLREGGVLILTTPHRPDLWTVVDDYAGHIQRFTVAQLRSLMAGFKVLELTTEGFPFQRLIMAVYDRMAQRSGHTHEFAQYGNSLTYRLYTLVMPWLLRVDHQLCRLQRGTTLAAVARRVAPGGKPGRGVSA